jgi:hypothetical protein
MFDDLETVRFAGSFGTLVPQGQVAVAHRCAARPERLWRVRTEERSKLLAQFR